MKKQFCAVLTAIMGTLGFTLLGVDITVDNKTPFKIVKYQLEDTKENITDHDVVIPAKSSKKVSFPDKGVEEITFIFENGLIDQPVFEELKLVHSFTFVFADKFSVWTHKRSKRTKYPLGQVKVSLAKEAKSFSIAPLGKNDEWQTCSVADAKKKLYSMPTSGKYMIKIEANAKPEQIFDNSGKGYDLSRIDSFSVGYESIDSDTDEDAGEDEDEDED